MRHVVVPTYLMLLSVRFGKIALEPLAPLGCHLTVAIEIVVLSHRQNSVPFVETHCTSNLGCTFQNPAVAVDLVSSWAETVEELLASRQEKMKLDLDSSLDMLVRLPRSCYSMTML